MEHLNCEVCNRQILLLPDVDVDPHWWGDTQPATNYWNIKYHEVYCSPECALEAHDKRKEI